MHTQVVSDCPNGKNSSQHKFLNVASLFVAVEEYIVEMAE